MTNELKIQSSTMMSRGRRALDAFRRVSPERYQRLFLQSERIRIQEDILSPIHELGLVLRDGNEWESPYIITAFRDLFIVTDPFTMTDSNRVFPLSDDESILLARNQAVREGDLVLDLGAGSGIQALCAAGRAKHVVATDVNDKALSYSRFNAALNGLNDKIEICHSDVFESLHGMQFDLIVSNPPVIPAPPGSAFFTHSDGGPLGMSVSSRLFKEGVKHLKANGRIQMLTVSFASEGELLFVSEIRKSLSSGLNWRLKLVEMYQPPLEQLALLTDRFRNVPGHQNWISSLESNRCETLHYLYVLGIRDRDYSLERQVVNQPQDRSNRDGSWEARLSRLFLAYPGNISSELASKKQVASAARGMF